MEKVHIDNRSLEKKVTHFTQCIEFYRKQLEEKNTNSGLQEDFLKQEELISKLRLEHEACLRAKCQLDVKISDLSSQKIELEAKLKETRSLYEKEVSKNNLYQHKNTNLQVSKSKLSSSTNIKDPLGNGLTATALPKSDASHPNTPSVKVRLEERSEKGSFKGRAWDDIKNHIHEKEEARLSKKEEESRASSTKPPARRPGAHQKVPLVKPRGKGKQNSPSESKSSNIEQEIASESDSSSEKIDSKLQSFSSFRQGASGNPTLVRANSMLPARGLSVSGVHAGPHSPDYKDKYREAVEALATCRKEKATMAMRLQKKDDFIGKLKKQAEALQAEADRRREERNTFKATWADTEKKLIIAQNRINDLESSSTTETAPPPPSREDRRTAEEIKSLQNRLQEAEGEISELRRRLESLKAELTTKDHQLILLQCRLEEAEPKLNTQ